MIDWETIHVDVCMPTLNSGDVIREALDCLAESIENSSIAVATLRVSDAHSTDGTIDLINKQADYYGWDTEIVVEDCNLPQARTRLIDRVETDWLLFLDDDVQLSREYLSLLADWVATDAIGAVHGRKQSLGRLHPTDYTRIRARRGGTHATLIRTATVRGIDIPDDVTVLEDEYIRRWIESTGYIWAFDHRAMLDHDGKGRHPIGYKEGFIAGKYGLGTLNRYALNVPFSVVKVRNPNPHIARAVGWVVGRFHRHKARIPTPETVGVAHETRGVR